MTLLLFEQSFCCLLCYLLGWSHVTNAYWDDWHYVTPVSICPYVSHVQELWWNCKTCRNDCHTASDIRMHITFNQNFEGVAHYRRKWVFMTPFVIVDSSLWDVFTSSYSEGNYKLFHKNSNIPDQALQVLPRIDWYLKIFHEKPDADVESLLPVFISDKHAAAWFQIHHSTCLQRKNMYNGLLCYEIIAEFSYSLVKNVEL